MFLWRSARLGVVGVGAAGAWTLARFLQATLYGVEPHDPFTPVLVATLLLGVSRLATFVPARRAARVDPVAIRDE
jgi:putative ABC transport system permease protein